MTLAVTNPAWTVNVSSRLLPELDGAPQHFVFDSSISPNWWNPYRPRYGPGMLLTKRTVSGLNRCPTLNFVTFTQSYTYLVFVAPDGTEHALYDELNRGILTSAACGVVDMDYSRGTKFTSRDGSGWTFVSDLPIKDVVDPSDPSLNVELVGNGDLLFPNGLRYKINNGLVHTIQDRNANQVTFTYLSTTVDGETAATTVVESITDPLGRVITISYAQVCGSTLNAFHNGVAGKCDKIEFKGASSNSRTITVRRDRLHHLSTGLSDSTLFRSGTRVIRNCFRKRAAEPPIRMRSRLSPISSSPTEADTTFNTIRTGRPHESSFRLGVRSSMTMARESSRIPRVGSMPAARCCQSRAPR